MLIYMPENEFFKDGYFDMNGIVKLLRDNADNPDAVRFIADMLEE